MVLQYAQRSTSRSCPELGWLRKQFPDKSVSLAIKPEADARLQEMANLLFQVVEVRKVELVFWKQLAKHLTSTSHSANLPCWWSANRSLRVTNMLIVKPDQRNIYFPDLRTKLPEKMILSGHLAQSLSCLRAHPNQLTKTQNKQPHNQASNQESKRPSVEPSRQAPKLETI